MLISESLSPAELAQGIAHNISTCLRDVEMAQALLDPSGQAVCDAASEDLESAYDLFMAAYRRYVQATREGGAHAHAHAQAARS